MGKHPKTVSDVAEKLFHLMKELGYSEATVRIYRRLYSVFLHLRLRTVPNLFLQISLQLTI